MNLTTMKSKIHKHAKNYIIIKSEYLTVNIIYQVCNDINLDMMIGSLEDLLIRLKERKEIRDKDNV